MYNLFRKSLKKLVVGLFVLLLFNCTTTSVSFTTSSSSIGMEELFSKSCEYLIYVDLDDNEELISEQVKDMNFSKNVKKIITSSHNLYIGVDSDTHIVLDGDFNKGFLELGLLFSFDWKRERSRDIKYWHNRSGLNLYIRDNKTIIISNGNIVGTIEKLGRRGLKASSGSAHIIVPVVSEKLLKFLTKGFMRSGIDSIELVTNRAGSIYSSRCVITLPSGGKARAFSRVIGLVLNLFIGNSTDSWIRNISDNIIITVDNSDVVIENIVVKDKNIVEMANKLIIMNREADK